MPGAGRLPGRVEQFVELAQARLGLPVRHTGLGVLAEHAEQPPHLGQRGPGGVADRRQPLRPGRGHPRGGQPGGLRLHGDHGDVVRHHVVQLAGDAGAFPPRRVLEQGARDDLPGGAVLDRVAAGPAVRSRPARPPGRARPAAGPGSWPQNQTRPSAPGPGTAAHSAAPAGVSRGGRAGTAATSCAIRPATVSVWKPASDTMLAADMMTAAAGRPGPQETERQRGGQADQRQDEQGEPPSRRCAAVERPAAGERAGHRHPQRLGHREHPEQHSRRDRRVRQRGESPPRRCPCARASHPLGPRKPLSPLVRQPGVTPGRYPARPSCGGCAGSGLPRRSGGARPLCGVTTPAAVLP